MTEVVDMNPALLLVANAMDTQLRTAKQTIADGRALVNGTLLLSEVTQKYTGKPGDTTGDATPIAGKEYNKEQCQSRMSAIAKYIHDHDLKGDELTKQNMEMQTWSTKLNGLDASLGVPTSAFNNMNKAKQSDMQQDQQNQQTVNGLGTAASDNIGFLASLLQQGLA
jgi:hypothetical protein